MITVACVLRSGGIYTPEHVRILEAMVSRNLDRIERFVCLTDSNLDIPHVEPIPLHHKWYAPYSKLELFRPIFKDGEHILYFDLGTVITGSLASVASCSQSFVACGPTSFEVMLWWAGDLFNAYRAFARNSTPYKTSTNHSYQARHLIARHAPRPVLWSEVLPGQVVSWSADCWDGLPTEARIVTFPGAIQPWNCSDEWVREHYTAEVRA